MIFRRSWSWNYLFFHFFFVLNGMQIINVYNQEYESSAAFWPDVHGRIIAALMISQLLLMGLLSTKEAATSTPFLLALPVLTIGFHMYCKGRYEPAFIRYPLQVRRKTFLPFLTNHHGRFAHENEYPLWFWKPIFSEDHRPYFVACWNKYQTFARNDNTPFFFPRNPSLQPNRLYRTKLTL